MNFLCANILTPVPTRVRTVVVAMPDFTRKDLGSNPAEDMVMHNGAQKTLKWSRQATTICPKPRGTPLDRREPFSCRRLR